MKYAFLHIIKRLTIINQCGTLMIHILPEVFYMKFIAIRELRSSTGHLKEMLSDEGRIVLTTNGKPTALMIEVSEDSFEDVLTDIRAAQARRAIRQLQERSAAAGLDAMTLDDINNEIASARRERAGQ
jgi:hypothetical protein